MTGPNAAVGLRRATRRGPFVKNEHGRSVEEERAVFADLL